MSPSHTLFPLLLLYRSTDNPPGIPAFTGSRGHRTSQMAALTSAVTQMSFGTGRYLEKLKLLDLEEKDDPYEAIVIIS